MSHEKTPAQTQIDRIAPRAEFESKPDECAHMHGDFFTLMNSEGRAMGFFCAECGTHWNVIDVRRALILYERERSAP